MNSILEYGKGTIATKELLKTIPKDELETIVSVCHTIKKFTKKRSWFKSLRNDLTAVAKKLKSLRDKGYITEIGEEFILASLMDSLDIHYNEKWVYLISNLVFDQKQAPVEWELDIYMFLMLFNMPKWGLELNYKTLATFASEQGLTDKSIEVRSLKQRVDRLDVNRCETFLEFFTETGDLQNLTVLVRRDIIHDFLREKFAP